MVIPFESVGSIDAPQVLIKGLEDLEMKGQVETIQTTAVLRSVRIMRRVLDT